MSRSSRPPPATWAPGAIIPGTVYRVIRPLGQGGMGEVYEAEHELLGARRALKVLSRKLADREDLSERLRVEARALAGLRHPNLVDVYDLGTSSDGRLFFAMELLAGGTLREVLRHMGALRADQAIGIGVQVLDALAAAHERGMIHRDVKPENVFVQASGVVKLLDFGVAKALTGNPTAQQLTAAGTAIGTPRYMSPEQAEGSPVDARADLYSMGVVLWEMLVGHPPYAHLDAVQSLVQMVTRGVPRLSDMGLPGVPPALAAVIDRSTSRDREQRHPSAAAFAAELRLAKARVSQSPPAPIAGPVDKITVRYEDNATSLRPLLAATTDQPTTPQGMTSITGQTAFDSTRHVPGDTAQMTAVDPRPAFDPTLRDLAAQTFPTIPTSIPSVTPRTPAPPEAAELRASLQGSFPGVDPRELPTPTSVPVSPHVASLPSLPSPPPAPNASARPSPAFWAALPACVVITALATWLSTRPSPSAALAAAPAPSPQLVASAAIPASPPAVSSPTEQQAAASASASAPPTVASPSTAEAKSDPARAAPRPAAPRPAPAAPPRPAGKRLPSSGL